MGLTDRLRSFITPVPIDRDAMWPYVNLTNGQSWPLLPFQQTLLGKEEKPDPGYPGLVGWAYATNPVVYACEQVRVQLFAEATFQWRRLRSGDRFGDQALGLLEVPWPNGTTGDLLTRMLLDADLGGDAFYARTNNAIARLRPDWVTVITDIDPWDPGSRVTAYAYQPGGPAGGKDPVVFLREQVAQFTPSPDPLSPHRGMPWLMPVIREISADKGMTEHKAAFLANGATPNTVVTLDPAISKAAFDQWTETFKKNHRGARNAYETVFLGGGAKIDVVGKDLQQLDFKLVQGGGETRIAAAAGVPPVIVGLSEGLQAATYSNYSQARRRFADGTMRPLWRNVCASLQPILTVPGGAELAIDDRDIAFLQDDMKDRAEIQATNAQAMKTLIDAGFEPSSVVSSVSANDLSTLSHTGLYSVQLQPPMPEGPPEPEPEPVVTVSEPKQLTDGEDKGRAMAFEALSLTRAAIDRPQPEPPTFNFYVTNPEHRTEVNVEPVTITVEPTPVEIRNEVSVEPTPVAITVEPTPVTIEAPDVTVNVPEQRATTKTIVREGGQITRIIEEPTDG